MCQIVLIDHLKEIYIDDLREEFARDFVFPMFRGNTIYEGEYLLGTSIARPLIAKRLIEIANETGADAISHGATGKGNDQVRFELGAYALKPGIKVIAPWREWDLTSRESLMAYCEARDIPVDFSTSKKKSPYSMDANLLHISYEGDILEEPWSEPEEDMWRWSVSPESAPDQPTYIELDYERVGSRVGMDARMFVSNIDKDRLHFLQIGSVLDAHVTHLPPASAPCVSHEPVPLWLVPTGQHHAVVESRATISFEYAS